MYVYIKAVCQLYDIPSEVIHYLVSEYYLPFWQRETEIVFVAQLHDIFSTRRTPYPSTKLLLLDNGQKREITTLQIFNAFTNRVEFGMRMSVLDDLLRNPWLRLDTRFKDNLIETYIGVIKQTLSIIEDSSCCLPILVKGLAVDSLRALRLLQWYELVDYCQTEVIVFVLRWIEKINLMPTWDFDQFSPIVYYLLDKKLEQPLLEWMIVWHARTTIYPFGLQKSFGTREQTAQLTLLENKAKGPEMRERRKAFILTGK